MELVYIDSNINQKETEILSDMLWDYHVRYVDEEYYKDKKSQTYKTVIGNDTSLIIKDKKEIVGFITTSVETFKLPQDEIFIHALYIRPFYRGQGIGTKVLKDLFKQSYDKGFSFIQLQVHENNNIALKLYKKFEFIPLTSMSKDKKQISMLTVVDDNINPIIQYGKHLLNKFKNKLFGGRK